MASWSDGGFDGDFRVTSTSLFLVLATNLFNRNLYSLPANAYVLSSEEAADAAIKELESEQAMPLLVALETDSDD